MDETPMTWLLDELRARGMTDLVEEYHARQRAYQRRLTQYHRDATKLSREESKARREQASEE